MFKVLIADNELDVTTSLLKIIETLPEFSVVGTADNGEEALRLLAEFEADLVITDIMMPMSNGAELAQEIRSRRLAAEIVMLSGYSEPAYYRRALRSGAADYLIKPIDTDEVKGVLLRIADKLRGQRLEISEKSDWVSVCKPSVQRLANAVWLMNDEAVGKMLDGLREHLGSHRYRRIQKHDMMVTMLTLLNVELREASGDRVHLERYAEYQSACLSGKGCDRLKVLLRKVMEDIRQMRNWGAHKMVRSALERIHQSFADETFSLSHIALSVGMSPNYFSKCFREEVGVSYTHYVTRLRMKKAIDLLNDPLFKVYEVAHATGFSDYSHFAKVFKKNYEFSPTQYRANIGIM